MVLKKYDMGLISVTAMGIGSVVGAGIFALLGEVILQAGNLSYYSFIIAGIAAMFSGYSYAKLSGKYPDSGGLTDYFKIAFKSRAVSGTFTLIYYITSFVSISMLAKSFGIYACKFLHDAAMEPVCVNYFASGIIIALAILNMMGADKVGNAETLMVAFKFFVLLSLIAGAFIELDVRSDKVDFMPTPTAFLGSIGITFFAYAGYGIITNAAADVKNPKFTIAAAIYLTIIIVALLYTSLAYIILKYIPEADLTANADTAITIVAEKLFGKWGYGIMFAAAIIAFISGISATYFSVFRISYALAEQKIMPKIYHKRFWEHGTYGNALSVAVLTLATIYFDFNSIVNLASGAYLVSYLAVFAASWVLRRETGASPVLILLGSALMVFILVMFLANIY